MNKLLQLAALLALVSLVLTACGTPPDDGIYQARITLKMESEGSSPVTVTNQNGEDQVVNFAPGGSWDSNYHKGTLRGEIISIVSRDSKEIKRGAGADIEQTIIIETNDEKVLSLLAGDTVVLDCRMVLENDASGLERYGAPHYCELIEVIPNK